MKFLQTIVSILLGLQFITSLVFANTELKSITTYWGDPGQYQSPSLFGDSFQNARNVFSIRENPLGFFQKSEKLESKRAEKRATYHLVDVDSYNQEIQKLNRTSDRLRKAQRTLQQDEIKFANKANVALNPGKSLFAGMLSPRAWRRTATVRLLSSPQLSHLESYQRLLKDNNELKQAIAALPNAQKEALKFAAQADQVKATLYAEKFRALANAYKKPFFDDSTRYGQMKFPEETIANVIPIEPLKVGELKTYFRDNTLQTTMKNVGNGIFEIEAYTGSHEMENTLIQRVTLNSKGFTVAKTGTLWRKNPSYTGQSDSD